MRDYTKELEVENEELRQQLAESQSLVDKFMPKWETHKLMLMPGTDPLCGYTYRFCSKLFVYGEVNWNNDEKSYEQSYYLNPIRGSTSTIYYSELIETTTDVEVAKKRVENKFYKDLKEAVI